jgi:hypothetical protein
LPPPPPAEKSEFDQEEGGGGNYTRSQSLEAGSFAVFIGGKRIPVRTALAALIRSFPTNIPTRRRPQVNQVVGGLVAAALLLVVIVSLVAGSGGGGDSTSGGGSAAVAAAGDPGYVASFSSLCGKTADDMDLEMAGNYPCDPYYPHARR